MKLKIYRGLPGSGKSTRAKEENPGWHHYEPDHYLCDTEGKYLFDTDLHVLATKQAHRMVDLALSRGHDVTYSEVLCTFEDVLPLLDIAHYYGAGVEVVTCIGSWKNVHSVPYWVMNSMDSEFVDGPVIEEAIYMQTVWSGRDK